MNTGTSDALRRAADALLHSSGLGVFHVRDHSIDGVSDVASRMVPPTDLPAEALVSAPPDDDPWHELTRTAGGVIHNLRWRRVPDRDGQGHTIFVEDVSDRAALNREFRERAAILNATLESLPFDFWMNDTEDRTILQNPVSIALWGDRFGERSAMVAATPEMRQHWTESNEAALAGSVYQSEQSYVIDGTTRWYRDIVAPVRDGDTIIGIVGMNIDITDLRLAIEERNLYMRELQHRVKNHLQLILSMIHLMQTSGTAHCTALDRVEERVRAVFLVHDLLYRTDSIDTVDVGHYLTDLITSVRDMKNVDIAYTVDLHRTPIAVSVAVPLGLVLVELLASAATGAAAISCAARVEESSVERAVVIDVSGPVATVDDGGEEGRFRIADEVARQINATIRSTADDRVVRSTVRMVL